MNDYRGSDQERADQLRRRGYPKFVKMDGRRAWFETLGVLAVNGQLQDAITPKNWAAANSIFQRMLAKRIEGNAHADERHRRRVEYARNLSLAPGVLEGYNERKRAEILAFDFGNWYVTRAGLTSHSEELTQIMFFHTAFVRVMDPDEDRLRIEPLFSWTIEVYGEFGFEGRSIHKVTHEVARWLVRDHPEVADWMRGEMTGALALLDETINEVEHEMPTIGGIDVPFVVLDHRATKDFIHAARKEIEAAISALPIRR